MQFFSVLLGVLLALLIGQWTNHRQQEARARAALRQQQMEVAEAMRAIRGELAANRTALHDSATQIYAAAGRMYAAAEKHKQPPRTCYTMSGYGVGKGTFVNLTQAAYQTAIATHAMANMPFPQAHLVAEVYGGQQVFDTGAGILRNKLLSTSPQQAGMCIGWMESLGLSEQSLNNAYTKLIGPDTTKWPALPVPVPGLTAKRDLP